MLRKGDWIQTYTGKQFWPLDPRPEDICLLDIAHALSNQCRFAGHTSDFYSVAQHSMRVALRIADVEDSIWGLLHDASEAYLLDLPRPLKMLPELAGYREAEKAVMRAVCTRYGLPLEQPEIVTRIDHELLVVEAKQFMGASHCLERWALAADIKAARPDPVAPLSPREAFQDFMLTAERLGLREPVSC